MTPRTKNHTHGFTLVELAIVLVVIGLLIGAVLAGKHMLRSYQAQTLVTDAARYMDAVRGFKDKYGALPGDMPDATRYWGEADSTLSTCIDTVGASTETCDGNGDGTIGLDSDTYYERGRAWQHLSNADMIEEELSGVVVNEEDRKSVLGVNAPASKMNAVGFSIAYFFTIAAGNANFFPQAPGHVLFLGRESADDGTFISALSSEEAKAIDTKLDDGLPAIGIVRGWKKTSVVNPDCTTSDDEADSEYDLMLKGQWCSLTFMLGL